jgi:thiol-disulfide isomerase/thioredoxin
MTPILQAGYKRLVYNLHSEFKMPLIFLMSFFLITETLSQEKITISLRPLKSAMWTKAAQEELISIYGSSIVKEITPRIIGGEVDGIFTISFEDADKNGSYDDIGTDYVSVSMHGRDSVFMHSSVSSSSIAPFSTIQAHNKIFKLGFVNIKNSSVDIVVCENCRNDKDFKPTVKLVDSVPNLQVKLIDESEINLRSLIDSKKMVYVDIWGTWCAPCITMLPELKEIYENHKSELTILSLNYRDSKEDVKKFVREHKINWLNGYSNNLINSELLLLGYPYGILFDGNGRLIRSNVNLKTLKEILSKSH